MPWFLGLCIPLFLLVPTLIPSINLSAALHSSQVIQECPNTSDPFHTLGLIYEAQGDARRALDFYMIAAHLTPKVARPCLAPSPGIMVN